MNVFERRKLTDEQLHRMTTDAIRKSHSCFELWWANNDIKQIIYNRHLLETMILAHPPPRPEKAQWKIIVNTIMISYYKIV